MPYAEKRIISGPMLEIMQYPVTEKGRQLPRAPKQHLSRKEQQALNEKNAIRDLNRRIMTNFTTRDLFVTLEYRKPVTPEQAKRNINNFLRRARDALRKMGVELKYILIDEAGRNGDNPHHHIIINNMAMELLETLWSNGDYNRYVGAFSRLRFDESGVAGLARYLTKEVRPKGARRWTPSKNLKKPEEPPPKIVKRLNIYRPPKELKGYKMVESETTDNVFTGAYRYIRYMRI